MKTKKRRRKFICAQKFSDSCKFIAAYTQSKNVKILTIYRRECADTQTVTSESSESEIMGSIVITLFTIYVVM